MVMKHPRLEFVPDLDRWKANSLAVSEQKKPLNQLLKMTVVREDVESCGVAANDDACGSCDSELSSKIKTGADVNIRAANTMGRMILIM